MKMKEVHLEVGRLIPRVGKKCAGYVRGELGKSE